MRVLIIGGTGFMGPYMAVNFHARRGNTIAGICARLTTGHPQGKIPCAYAGVAKR